MRRLTATTRGAVESEWGKNITNQAGDDQFVEGTSFCFDSDGTLRETDTRHKTQIQNTEWPCTERMEVETDAGE